MEDDGEVMASIRHGLSPGPAQTCIIFSNYHYTPLLITFFFNRFFFLSFYSNIHYIPIECLAQFTRLYTYDDEVISSSIFIFVYTLKKLST